MTLDPTNPAPQPCPLCGKDVLVRRVATGTAVLLFDPDPTPTGVYMLTATTAAVVRHRGSGYSPHVLTCSKGATG